MIKSLVILTLLFVLAAGAFLSRPKPGDFKPFLKQKMEQQSKSLPGRVWADFQVDRYVDSCKINDRLLWVTVEKDARAWPSPVFLTPRPLRPPRALWR